MPHTARPTLRSLAAEAGVSAMTISLALRGSNEVSAEVKKKITRLAIARGYRTDPSIVKLMHHLRTRAGVRFKTTLCGLGHIFAPDQFARGNYGDRLHDGLSQRAAALGFAYERLFLDDFSSGAQLERVLLSRGIEGVIILPLRHRMDLTDLLDWSKFATVSATPAVLAPNFHSAMPNHFDNMMLLTAALSEAGFRRIGLAIPSDWNRRVRFRWSGAIAWQNLFGPGTPIPPLFTQRTGPNLDPEEFASWLVRERPDVVITDSTHHTALAPGLAQLPRHQRPKMVTMNWPDSAAVAGLDQRGEHVGSVAIDLIAGMLTRGERGIPTVAGSTMVTGTWVPGTLKARKRRSRAAATQGV